MTHEHIVAGLDEVLTEERAALLSGRIAELEELGRRKLQLLEEVQAADLPVGTPRWAELRDRNARNGALLEAAQRGVRESRARLGLIHDGGPALKTYDRQGRAVAHAQMPKLVKKRS